MRSDIDILTSAGLDPVSAEFHARALEALASGARGGTRILVPGRIELLGKHTDYAGGSSVTCASSRCIRVVARGREDGVVRIHEPELGRYAALEAGPGASAAPGHWSAYAATVIRRVASNAPGIIRGVDLWISSDLPRAAGMSSSSAFMIAVFLGLDAASGLRDAPSLRDAVRDRDALAGYLGSVENGSSFGALAGERGVGTSGGSEDHVAILLSRAGRLGRYRYAPFEREGDVPIPDGMVLVVGASGVTAKKTGAARERYNTASDLAREATRAWSAATGEPARHLADVIARDPAAADLAGLDPALSDRMRHLAIEHAAVIPRAWEALRTGDLRSFGASVARSQKAAEELLGNQVPETAHLAASATRLGAVAASAFGAGFGGAVWAMVPAEEADRFVTAWRADYQEAFPNRRTRSRFFVEPTGPGATRLDGADIWPRG